jgi:hypothetical protein
LLSFEELKTEIYESCMLDYTISDYPELLSKIEIYARKLATAMLELRTKYKEKGDLPLYPIDSDFEKLEDFLHKRNTTAFGDVLPTYLPGTEFNQVDSYLPDYIANSLRQAIEEMGIWMPGFAYPDALLTGAETRSSSPVRITRGDSLEAIGIKGLYPCGEGAGYAGGIVSAAVDGMLCAERILEG